MEGLSKKEIGLMDMDNSVVIAVGRCVRGLNGNGKNITKIKQNKTKQTWPGLHEIRCLPTAKGLLGIF